MEKLSSSFAEWLVNKGADAENKEIYAYSMECLLNTILTFGIILITGAVLNLFAATVVWSLFFLPLRHSSGGLHAPNHIGCLIISLSVGIGCMLLNALLVGIVFPLVLAGVAGSIAIVFALAPVIHRNHPLSQARIAKMRKIARILMLAEGALCILLLFAAPASITVAAVLGILSASISSLVGRLLN